MSIPAPDPAPDPSDVAQLRLLLVRAAQLFTEAAPQVIAIMPHLYLPVQRVREQLYFLLREMDAKEPAPVETEQPPAPAESKPA